MSSLRSCVGIVIVINCVVWSFGQSPPDGQTGSAGVSIPVTVMNRSREPVRGLKASSFSLSQSGRMRTLESVLEVAPVTAGKAKVKVAFVVLDAIGISSTAQGETRKECLQLLADSVTNESLVSLSEIDHDGLHAIHELGAANSILVSALLQLDTESKFLTNRDQLKAMHGTAEDKPLVAAETDRLRHFRQGTVESANMMGTLLTQLQAFQTMAIALQHAQGRKTVVWLTSSFPVEINDVEDSINVNSYGRTSPFPVKSATVDYQRTIDLLNNAQISIFPVLMAVDLRKTPSASVLPIDSRENVVEQRTATGLRQIAQSTGGESMFFSDALQNLVKQAEDRSGVYYLLTFHPDMPKTDVKWTNLRVQVSDQSLDVRSPSGRFVLGVTK